MNQIKRRKIAETCTAPPLPLNVCGVQAGVRVLEEMQQKLKLTVKDAKEADRLSQSSHILELQER